KGGSSNVFGGGGVLNEFWIDGITGQQIGHGQEIHLNDTLANLVSAPGGLIERDSRDAKVGALHSDGSGRGDGQIGLTETLLQTADLDDGFARPREFFGLIGQRLIWKTHSELNRLPGGNDF